METACKGYSQLYWASKCFIEEVKSGWWSCLRMPSKQRAMGKTRWFGLDWRPSGEKKCPWYLKWHSSVSILRPRKRICPREEVQNRSLANPDKQLSLRGYKRRCWTEPWNFRRANCLRTCDAIAKTFTAWRHLGGAWRAKTGTSQRVRYRNQFYFAG